PRPARRHHGLGRPGRGDPEVRERPRASTGPRAPAARLVPLGPDADLAESDLGVAIHEVARAVAHPVPSQPHGLRDRLGVIADRHRGGGAVAAVDHVVADEAVDLLDPIDKLLLDLAHERVDVAYAIAADGSVHQSFLLQGSVSSSAVRLKMRCTAGGPGSSSSSNPSFDASPAHLTTRWSPDESRNVSPRRSSRILRIPSSWSRRSSWSTAPTVAMSSSPRGATVAE